MGTTPLYGWPYPEPTAPVRDGALAIKDLATAISNTFNARMGGMLVQGGHQIATTNAAGAVTITFPIAYVSDPGIAVLLGSPDVNTYLWVPAGYAPQTTAGFFTVIVYNLRTQSAMPAGAGIDVYWTATGPAPPVSGLLRGAAEPAGLADDAEVQPYTFADPPPYLPDDPAVLAGYGTTENPWPAPPDDWTT